MGRRIAVTLAGVALGAGAFASAAVADPSEQELTDVACVTAQNCWAVGISPGPGLQVNQGWHWTGGRWAAASVPTPSDSWLHGVTCTSAKNCWAVGIRGTHNQALYFHDGRWSAVSTPQPTRGSGLSDVACVSASDCWAVGVSGSGNEALHWNGLSWSHVKTPQPGNVAPNAYHVLNGVACASSSLCLAVGGYESGNSEFNETLRWNGERWTSARAPQPEGTNGGAAVLESVDCTSPENCWAVGHESGPTDGFSRSEAFRWGSGGWTAARTPQANGNDSVLNGVTCASPSRCWAVGYRGSRDQLLRWNGSAWGAVSGPNPGHDNTLFSAACASAGSCLAVGFRTKQAGGTNFNLALRWNGSGWSNVTP